MVERLPDDRRRGRPVLPRVPGFLLLPDVREEHIRAALRLPADHALQRHVSILVRHSVHLGSERARLQVSAFCYRDRVRKIKKIGPLMRSI